jgi:indolepyruvate ferredoxin oxidoreductase alpha subunit
VLPPASFLHEKEKLEKRWPAAVEFIKARKLNEFFGPQIMVRVGIIMQGGMYNNRHARAAAARPGRCLWRVRVPLYVLNVTYPLIDDEIRDLLRRQAAVLMVEEGQPEYIEQALNTLLRRRDIQTRLHRQGHAADGRRIYRAGAARRASASSCETHARLLLGNRRRCRTPARSGRPRSRRWRRRAAAAGRVLHGCPERPIFAAMKLVEKELGQHHISADIGCHLFSILPPFNIGATTMGYGLGPAGLRPSTSPADKRSIAIMGDGGFWHNGLTSSIGNAVFNKQDGVIVIVDNYYSAATGGQDILSSRARNPDRKTNNRSTESGAGIGAKWVRQIDRTYDVAKMRDTLREALTTKEKGPKIIVASSECMLNKQRRDQAAARQGGEGRQAHGARALRRRRGCLHRRPCLHPPLRLPVAVGQAHRRSRCATIRSRHIDNSAASAAAIAARWPRRRSSAHPSTAPTSSIIPPAGIVHGEAARSGHRLACSAAASAGRIVFPDEV